MKFKKSSYIKNPLVFLIAFLLINTALTVAIFDNHKTNSNVSPINILRKSTQTSIQQVYTNSEQNSALYQSHPTSHTITGITVTDPQKAYDGNPDTYASFSYTTSGSFEVKSFTTLPNPWRITRVDFLMRYNTTISSNDDTYRIIYYVGTAGPVVLKAWKRDTVTLGDYSWPNRPEPTDGTWDWTDVGNIRFRIETNRAGGSDSGGLFRAYEIWVTVHYRNPTLYVDPPSVETTVAFSVNINITNVDNLYAWEFNVTYNTALLTATNVVEGPFLSSEGPTQFNKTINDARGWVYAYASLLGDIPPVTGNGTLATISFSPDAGGESTLDLYNTKLVEYAYVSKKAYLYPPYYFVENDGYVKVSLPTHDIAVTSVTTNTTAVTTGGKVKITVIVENQGDFTESFSVTTYYNDASAAPSQTVTDLASKASTTLEFIWDTTGVPDGTYTVSTKATQVPGETEITDNTSTNGQVTVTAKKPPLASFTYSPSTPLAGETVTFDASASTPDGGTIASYAWDFGDGTPIVTETDPLTTHIYSTAGTYTVTLTITDTEGLTDAESKPITIYTLPVASFTYSPLTPTVFETVTFDASASYDPDGGLIATYAWDFGDGSPAGSGKTVTHTYSTATTFNVKLTVTDDEGQTATATQPVTIGKLTSSITIKADPASLTLGSSTTLSGAITPARPSVTVTLWFRLSGETTWNTLTTTTTNSLSQYSYAWTPTAVGNYELKASWPGDAVTLPAESSVITLTVTPALGPPVASFTYSPASPLIDDTVTFDASASFDPDGTIVSYAWDFGDGAPVVTEPDPITTHIYSSAGNYLVALTITDNDGLTGTDSKTVTVTKITSSITIQADPTAITLGSSTTISGLIDPIRPGVTVTISYRLSGEVSWNILANPTTNDASQYSHVWTPPTAGTYQLKTSWSGDAKTLPAESTIITVTVFPPKQPPIASFTYSPTSPVVGGTINFDASASYDPDGGSIVSYSWDFGDSTAIVTVTVPTTTHVYTNVGTYTITLIVTDDEGDTDTTSQLITIGKASSAISISADPAIIKIGSSTTVSGSISPIRPSTTVTIWHRLSGEASWSILTTVTTNDVSQYSFVWTPTAVGGYELKASWSGDDNTLPAESSAITVNVMSEAKDTTPPTITINEPVSTDYLHSETLTFDFYATDPQSGVASVTAMLDDKSVTDGQVIELFTLSLGEHTLTVTAIDNAGNRATETVSFNVVATIDSLIDMVEKFSELGYIGSPASGITNSLLSKLNAAKAKIEAGQIKGAVNNLNAFINQVKAQSGKHITVEAANILITDADYVIADIYQYSLFSYAGVTNAFPSTGNPYSFIFTLGQFFGSLLSIISSASFIKPRFPLSRLLTRLR